MTANEFHAARKALGLSQTEMAEALDIGFRTVQRIEREGCSVAMGYAVQHLLAAAKIARMEEALRAICETRWDTGAAEACLFAVVGIARNALQDHTGDKSDG